MNHFVNQNPIDNNYPEKFKRIIFGAGCFWGVEKKFWQLDGVWVTSVGYSGGNTEYPTYEDICYKDTNHVEVVEVIYDPSIILLNDLLKVFWECHDPTQGMRQGNDRGTQYRSVIFCDTHEDIDRSRDSKKIYEEILKEASYGSITTEIAISPKYYLAEEYHQQYLAKNPNGYCGIGGTGCSISL